MSEKICGPLLPADKDLLDNWLSWKAPSLSCPVGTCEHTLVVRGAWFHGGLVSGVTWLLSCPKHRRRFQWTDAADATDDVERDEEATRKAARERRWRGQGLTVKNGTAS